LIPLNKRKSPMGTITKILLLLLGIYGVFYFMTTNLDKTPPVISMKYDKVYANTELKFSDNVNIKRYIISITDGNEVIVVLDEEPKDKKNLIINWKIPKLDLFFKKENASIRIEVIDNSSWNFFMGNKIIKEVDLIFDDKAPEVSIISKSPYINKGGSALVIFSVKDKNLDEDSIYIESNKGKRFKPIRFKKDGYYVTLVAWDMRDKTFRLNIIAKDRVNNTTTFKVRMRNRKKIYKTSKIKLKNKFLKGKIQELYEELSLLPVEANKIDKFISINEKQRSEDEKVIFSNSNEVVEDSINDFHINTFIPLRKYATVGRFGVFRKFSLNRLKISTSYHMGIDIASVKNDAIKSTNNGKVVFAGYNGIYGNTVIVYHKLGLYSLYSHCSEFYVNKGNTIKKGEVFAHTGKSGLALGDHLHFSMIVQGVFVRPYEWISDEWIQNNILNVIKVAKANIN